MTDHLAPEAKAMLTRSANEKIEFLRLDHFIEYTQAKEIIDDLHDLMNYPKTIRMPCRALIGDSRSGKSTILHEFHRHHPTVIDASGYPIVPLVYVEMPSTPKESRLWSEILKAMSVPHRPDSSAEKLEPLVHRSLIERRVKMVMFDEFHSSLVGTEREQRAYMVVIKRFHNYMRVPIVVSGISTTYAALGVDPQFIQRFEKTIIRNWEPDENFLSLVAGFESLIPLPKPSLLSSIEKANVIYQGSRKTIGTIKAVILHAAKETIRAGKDSIEFAQLQASVKHMHEVEIAA